MANDVMKAVADAVVSPYCAAAEPLLRAGAQSLVDGKPDAAGSVLVALMRVLSAGGEVNKVASAQLVKTLRKGAYGDYGDDVPVSSDQEWDQLITQEAAAELDDDDSTTCPACGHTWCDDDDAEKAAKAAEYRRLAVESGDPVLRKGYLEMASRLVKQV